MNDDIQQAQRKLATLLSGEQPCLLRLCTDLTGEPAAAEDLVQETFIEAWRQVHKIDVISAADTLAVIDIHSPRGAL